MGAGTTGEGGGGHRYPAIAVDMVIFAVAGDDLAVLLVRRRNEPYRGRWAIPGGFVEEGESLDDAAGRELREETGVADVYLEQLYTFGEPGRDPRGRVISVAYFALLRKPRAVAGADDAEDARWFPLGALPPLAFDHAAILDYARVRLRYKIEYTNVVYSLLPDTFTLTELQRVYEIILGRPLDKRNFRKKIGSLDLVEPTGGERREGAHRPARLYRFRSREPMIVEIF
ncbi:MAG TPA: NUDIX domain-containing protein [Thermomicrobiales bacterium]|nr:NUDIX domain-containing protein [Thermomicrobiales bacterium]